MLYQTMTFVRFPRFSGESCPQLQRDWIIIAYYQYACMHGFG